jgi:hypothetical protein
MIPDNEPDDGLAARLGAVLARRDPVPSSVIAAAKASRVWRAVDAELALLLHDSAVESDELAGVRGGGSRLLTFVSPGVTVELEVLGRGRGLIGQVVAKGGTRVELCEPERVVPVEVDRTGHFSSTDAPAGPMSVRVTDERSGAVTQTEWVAI